MSEQLVIGSILPFLVQLEVAYRPSSAEFVGISDGVQHVVAQSIVAGRFENPSSVPELIAVHEVSQGIAGGLKVDFFEVERVRTVKVIRFFGGHTVCDGLLESDEGIQWITRIVDPR